MSNATRGIYLERRVAELLAQRGWFTIRAAGSHGIADVVAVAPGVVVFVQCKTGGVVSGTEWNRLWQVTGTLGAIPVVAQYATATHRSITFLEIMGPHVDHSKKWDWREWHPGHVSPLARMDSETAAKVAELELERLNHGPRHG